MGVYTIYFISSTMLAFGYNTQNEMLEKVVDQAFINSNLTLVEAITYDRMDRLKQASFCQPATSSAVHQIQRTPDSLNRIASWKALWQEPTTATTQLDEERTYTYDKSGHIAAITSSANPTSPLFRYSYDSLDQIKQAAFKPDAQTSAETHTFSYDLNGLGNLIAIDRGSANGTTSVAVAKETNLLVAANYNIYGEQVSDQRNAIAYTMGYNSLGRMTSYVSDPTNDPTSAQYHYDQDGMRIHTQTTSSQGDQEERLYFYDADKLVVCEWLAKNENNQWQAHWDKSYLYLNGQSTFTYEYDAVPGANMASGASLPQAVILLDGALTWTATTAPYTLALADDRMQPLRTYAGLKTANFNFTNRLKYGKYHVRLRGMNATWGPWQEVFYMDAASQDLVGEYGFDQSGDDESYFKNHLDNTASVGFDFGQYFDALAMDPGERVVITDPHRFQAAATDATLALWLKLPPGNAFAPKKRRLLWDYDLVALWVDNHGAFEIKPKGQAYEPASVGIATDTWAHVAVVYGDGTARLYVNGQLALNAANVITPLSHNDLILGSLSTSNGFDGLLDRLRIFNRGLSPAEIQVEATP